MREIEEIRRMDASGRSRSAIAREVGVSRPTVAKYLDQEDFSPPAPGPVRSRGRMIEPFVPWLVEVLEADKRVPAKQRHTAQRLLDRLRAEQGFTGISG